jgi:hypothetical protein
MNDITYLLHFFKSIFTQRKHNKLMKKIFSLLVILFLFLAPTAVNAQTPKHISDIHIQKRLHSVNGSGVEGIVDLVQRPHNSGTHITLLGFGLQPGNQYVSLYYDNHVCNLEPYSVDDVIGGVYTANAAGVGVTQANQEDNLDAINSISIRNASDFHLLACADIHP